MHLVLNFYLYGLIFFKLEVNALSEGISSEYHIIDLDVFIIGEATFLVGRDTVVMNSLNELKTNNNGYLYRCHSEGNNFEL